MHFLTRLTVALFLFLTAHAFAEDCRDCECFEIDLEYLYWNAREDGLTFAVSASNLAPAGGAFTEHAPLGELRVTDNKFSRWSSGCRVGAAYYIPNSCWDLDFKWTFFQTSTNRTTTKSPFAVLVLNYFTEQRATAATSRFNLHFNSYRLDAGYCMDLPCCLRVKPRAGVYGVTIDQRQNVKYSGLFDNLGQSVSASARRKNNFWGVGPNMGVDLQWFACGNLSFIARADAALVFGRFDVGVKNIFKETTFTATPFFNQHLYRGRPMFGSYLGLAFDSCVCRIPFEVAVGYETQYFWQQWHVPANFDTLENGAGVGTWGDLFLHGLTVALTFTL